MSVIGIELEAAAPVSRMTPTAPLGGHRRLSPSRLSSRYYILTLLRDALARIVETELAARNALTLVDLGCGTMPYRPLFESHVAEYIGVDLPGNPHATVHGHWHETVPLPSASADVVLSTQVLEHVSDPPAHLRECHRILKPEGLLILSTHGYWMYHPDPHDLWRWTGEGLKKTLTDAGFRIDAWRGLMGLAPSGVTLVQDSLTSVVPRFARPLFWFLMQTLSMVLDRVHSDRSRAADACVFVAAARKPGGPDGRAAVRAEGA